MPAASAHPFPEIAVFFDSVGASRSAPVSVAVGVSGGADSIALLNILYLYRGGLGIGRLAAVGVFTQLKSGGRRGSK